MKTYTSIFQSMAARQIPTFGLLFLMLSFSSILGVKAQNISEVNQFLDSQESIDLGIDRNYLYGNKPTVYVNSSGINLPQGSTPKKVNVTQNNIGKIAGMSTELETVEILQVKVTSEAQISGSIPSSAIEQMPSLKVIFIISEVPITLSEVQSKVSQIQNPAVKILYVYSQPV